MTPDLTKTPQKKHEASSVHSLLQQAQDILIDLGTALKEGEKIWLQLKQDNPHIEQASTQHWRENSSKYWLHGATDVFESNELERWLFTHVELPQLAQQKASYLIGCWKKRINENKKCGHCYSDDRKFIVRSKRGETLIVFIIRMMIGTEKHGKGHKTTWRALKSFLHFLREAYPSQVAFLEQIFPKDMDVVHSRIVRKIPSEVYPIPLETAGDIIRELAAMCTKGRPDAQLGFAETLGFC